MLLPVRCKEIGGPGSGNFGHVGVPGKVGGSGPSEDEDLDDGEEHLSPVEKGKEMVHDYVETANSFAADQLRWGINVLNGKNADDSLSPMQSLFSKSSRGLAGDTTKSIRALQEETQKLWDEKYPTGQDVFRGIRGPSPEYEDENEDADKVSPVGKYFAMIKSLQPGDVMHLGPLISASTDSRQASVFAGYSQKSAAILVFKGARGTSVLASIEVQPHLFGERRPERETILTGQDDWKVTKQYQVTTSYAGGDVTVPYIEMEKV